ncbi:MAG: hypothetical protein AAGF11_36445, partial [Myxococcota bacterium]
PDDYLLVARRNVLDLRDPARARAFLASGQLPAETDTTSEIAKETVIDTMVEALATGLLVPVRIDHHTRLMKAPDPRPLVEPGSPPPRPPLGRTERILELEVLHQTGGTFAGARFVVELPDGTLIDGILDDRSRWSYPGLATTEPCSVRFYEPLRLTEDQQRRPSTGPCSAGPKDSTTPVGTVVTLPLRPGARHRLVVEPPPPVPALGLDAGVFVPGQAFITPGIGASLDALTDALRDEPGLRISALANADDGADPQRAKDLSDRRALALATLLTNDADAFDALARADGWSLRHDQAMLRGLGCNPAAIDGIEGPLTRRAVRWFQAEWSDGVHHPDGLDEPLVTGTLDEPTRRALRKAYLLALSPQLSPEQLASPHGIGCGGFTLPPPGPAPARHGSLALWSETPSPPRRFPCRTGDPGACRLDDRDAHDRCRFHRETFQIQPSPGQPTLHDFDWLRLPSGSFNLSAITSLPDGTHVRVHVMRDVQDYDGRVRHHHGHAPLPARGTPVGPPVDGIVRYGICVALWSAPDGWDPLDWRQWWTDRQPEDGRAPEPGALFHPPLFAIEYEGGWAFSRPPGERIDRFALRNAGQEGLALTSDGGFVSFGTTPGDRIVAPQQRRADEHLQIIGWCSHRHQLQEGRQTP